MSAEYRVRWQRKGRNPASRIYQTWDAAYRKAQSVAAMDAIKADTSRWADMPDLVEPPALEQRTVGEWEAVPHAQTVEASEYTVRRMREWAGYNDVAEPVAEGDIPF